METENSQNMTPMVRQYREIKSRHPDKILFFRVGDFYEMFFEDAHEAANILHLALTSRNDLPMAGIPYHAASQYIQKLIAAGKKVAICEQVENPAQAKGLVRREITDIITPATVVEEHLVQHNRNNYLGALALEGDSIALAFADISTGELDVVSVKIAPEDDRWLRVVEDELSTHEPRELLCPEGVRSKPYFKALSASLLSTTEFWPDSTLDRPFAHMEKLESSMPEAGLSGASLQAVRGVFRYLADTQGISAPDFEQTLLAILARVRKIDRRCFVEMDDFTLRNLELVKNMRDGGRDFTLLDVIDRTATPMGGRQLRKWLLMPLLELPAIRQRQDSVEALFEDSLFSKSLREKMSKLSDLERLCARLSLGKFLPRDLSALGHTLRASAVIREQIAPLEVFQDISTRIHPLTALSELFLSALCDEPASQFEGGVIRRGFHAELDSLRDMMETGKDTILKMQEEERKKTGIQSLKIRYNNIFGYFIEVSKANLDLVPAHYVRKQSLVNAERYTLPELAEYESKIATATERLSSLEKEVFDSLVAKAAGELPALRETALALSTLDCYLSLADAAREHRYIRPELNESGSIDIEEARHPVVEAHMAQGQFVPNDIRLDDEEERVLIITGPNMAGKSTYLRQCALIVILAQMGSFIPAKKALMGLTDRIFTRIGASDNLSQGQSTFLVEMQEAANIIKHCTPKSLIVMDELGRGTSTYDGLSIAWAVVEYLQENPSKSGKTLFATHYHELTRLGEKKGIANMSIAVREYKDELIFLRKVVNGPADRSYGIHVAKIAGLLPEIVDRARLILSALENEGIEARDRIEQIIDQSFKRPKEQKSASLELFSENPYRNVADKIRNIDPERMTPLEALTFLTEIRKEVG